MLRVVAMLHFDGQMREFLVFAQQRAVFPGRLRLVGNHGDDGREFSRGHLPDMQVGHERIAIRLDRPANLVRQIG